MPLFKRRPTSQPDNTKPEPTAVERYLSGGGNPNNTRALALMAEVDQGREHRNAGQQATTRRDAALKLPDPPEPTGKPVTDAINTAEHQAAVDRIRWEAEEKRMREEGARADLDRAEFLTHCRPATPTEYADWLRGHLNRGGHITNTMQRNMDDVWTLTRPPSDVPTLYGADSLDVIVPADVNFTPRDLPRTFHGECGHSTFYFMSTFEVVGSFVPLYDDVKALMTR